MYVRIGRGLCGGAMDEELLDAEEEEVALITDVFRLSEAVSSSSLAVLCVFRRS